MIVKVQLSQHTTAGTRQVLVYDQSRRFTYEGDAPADVVDRMHGRDRAFFEAAILGTQFLIGHETPEQDW